MTLRQEDLQQKRSESIEPANRLSSLNTPAIDPAVRERLSQTGIQIGIARYDQQADASGNAPAGSAAPGAAAAPANPNPQGTEPAQDQAPRSPAPRTRIRASAPVTTSNPAEAADPAAPAATAAPVVPTTKPADLVFTDAALADRLNLGYADPAKISHHEKAEAIKQRFLDQALGEDFRARHTAAQNAGEISQINSQFIKKEDHRQTGTVTAWKADTVPEGDSRSNVQIIMRDTGVSQQMAAAYNSMMERQGLPMAVTDQDVIRGMELFRQSIENAEAKWNAVRGSLPVGHTPEDEAKRNFELAKAASELRIEAATQSAQQGAGGGQQSSQGASQDGAAPGNGQPRVATRESAWSQIAGLDARIGREQLGQFMTPEQQQALAAVASARPNDPMQFSQSMVRALAVNEFGERYWKRWSQELQAERGGAGPVTPGREGFWAGGEMKPIDRTNPGYSFVVQELEKRRAVAASNGEDPSVFALKVSGGNVAVNRAALVATLTGRSYNDALRFDEAMSVTLDGQGKYDFGAPGQSYQQLGQQMGRYMNDFDQSVNKSIERINKLNRTLGDRKADKFDYREDTRAIARFSQELQKDIVDSQKAHQKALDNAAGTARGFGLTGFGSPRIFINPFPGRPPIL